MADGRKLQKRGVLRVQAREAEVADRAGRGLQAEGSGWFCRLAVEQSPRVVEIQRGRAVQPAEASGHRQRPVQNSQPHHPKHTDQPQTEDILQLGCHQKPKKIVQGLPEPVQDHHEGAEATTHSHDKSATRCVYRVQRGDLHCFRSGRGRAAGVADFRGGAVALREKFPAGGGLQAGVVQLQEQQRLPDRLRADQGQEHREGRVEPQGVPQAHREGWHCRQEPQHHLRVADRPHLPRHRSQGTRIHQRGVPRAVREGAKDRKDAARHLPQGRNHHCAGVLPLLQAAAQDLPLGPG